jgi:hypothetical protein
VNEAEWRVHGLQGSAYRIQAHSVVGTSLFCIISSISSSRANRDTPKERNTVRAMRDKWAPRLTKGTCGLSTSPSGEGGVVDGERWRGRERAR